MKIWSNAALLGHALALVACSGLKLDKDSNCLNASSGCFKPDKTAPMFSQSLFPIENTQVSQIPYVDLRFSEELKDPKVSDFVISGPGKGALYVYSVEKKDNFTYRLIMGSTAVADNAIYIDFDNLKDYNGNLVTNKTRVTFIGNTQVGVRLTSQPFSQLALLQADIIRRALILRLLTTLSTTTTTPGALVSPQVPLIAPQALRLLTERDSPPRIRPLPRELRLHYPAPLRNSLLA
ncbi:MAG: hypothetical protein KF713_05050 [Turneriella sp.]|nr:hypothetical protein [Turneriella sp.]